MASRTCWHCGNDSHMTRLTSPYRPRGRHGRGTWLVAASCDGCGRPNIAEFDVDDSKVVGIEDNRIANARIVFDGEDDLRLQRIDWQPNNVVVKAVEDVPSGIDEAAGEAIAALSIGAYKASVLMCRAVIEATAKQHKIEKGSLHEKITKLEEQRVITPSTAEAAHEVRHLGNDMAHGDFATTTVTEAEAGEVMEITEALLAEVYQRPARIERMKQRRLDK